MKSEKPLPRPAVIEDPRRSRGWAAAVREAEVELERWVERRRRVRQQHRNVQSLEARKDGRRG